MAVGRAAPPRQTWLEKHKHTIGTVAAIAGSLSTIGGLAYGAYKFKNDPTLREIVNDGRELLGVKRRGESGSSGYANNTPKQQLRNVLQASAYGVPSHYGDVEMEAHPPTVSNLTMYGPWPDTPREAREREDIVMAADSGRMHSTAPNVPRSSPNGFEIVRRRANPPATKSGVSKRTPSTNLRRGAGTKFVNVTSQNRNDEGFSETVRRQKHYLNAAGKKVRLS